MRASFFFLLALCLAYTASAKTYYADISVDLDSSGGALFSGASNHPLLSEGRNDSHTSKKGALWLFNLTLPSEDIFSDYVYVVRLPQGASVNYVKADSFRISSGAGRILVSGSGSSRPMSVVIQYRMDDNPQATDTSYIYGFFAIILAVLASIAFLLYNKKETAQKEKKETVDEPAREEKKPSIPITPNYSRYEDVLTDRQKDILQILGEMQKPVNQAHICERLDLPKSSVSRNVASLVDLGLVEKKRIGMSTFLSLKQE
jgi:uncharacterized membrane protein